MNPFALRYLVTSDYVRNPRYRDPDKVPDPADAEQQETDPHDQED
jgi:hypothetical protein